MKSISLKVPDGLNSKLERMAKVHNRTKSDIIREAIESMLDGTRPSKPLSVLELAGDLVGCCKGPGDLSTNPKYMEGFGE